MTDDRPPLGALPTPELRAQAEALLRTSAGRYPQPLEALPPEQAQRAMHELAVHAIELELQNEELRQQQAALDAARTHFTDFYDQAPVGYVALDEAGRIARANLATATMLGVTRSALSGHPFTQYLFWEDQSCYAELRQVLLKSDGVHGCELRLLRADRSPFWVKLMANVGHDEDGAPTLRFVLTDLTDRKLVEAATQRLTRLYAARSHCSDAILRCASEAELFPAVCAATVEFGGVAMAWIGLTDEATREVKPVASVGDARGYLSGIQISVDGDEPTGRGPTGTAIREGVAVWSDDFAADPRTEPWQGRGNWGASASLPLRRDGVAIGALNLYTTEAHAFDRETRTLVLEIAQDISLALDRFAREAARQKAEEALRQSEEVLSALVRHSPIYVYLKEVTATESRVLRVSDNYVNMVGIRSADMVGKTMGELFPRELAAKMTEDDWLVVSAGKVLTVDEEHDGHFYTSVKFPIGVGERTLLAGYTLDTTERRAAEAARAELEAKSGMLAKAESLGRMAGAIAHHFNNQLHALMMSLEVAMDELPRDASPFETLTEAWQSARSAADMSTQMLAYLGHTRGRREALDLSEVCERQLPVLQEKALRGLRVVPELPSPGPVVHGNANELQRVLSALVSNAAEATTDARRPVRLTVKTVAASEIPKSNRFPLDWQPQDESYACLEVADAGAGIALKDIVSLFDPFFSTKFVGRGLGLPVALGIVRAHDGVITVESEPGRGSVFRVFLRALTEEAPRKSVTGLRAPAPALSGTVLFVDDEPRVRRAVVRALERSGFQVLAASDGAEAVELFRTHRQEIVCVLCDVSMPRMDGWQTLHALRALAPGFPVVLASGYSEAHVMGGEHGEQPTAFLSKPYHLETLIETLSKVLGGRKE